jgi:hypothetical protein
VVDYIVAFPGPTIYKFYSKMAPTVNMKVKDEVLVDSGVQELQLIAGKNITNILMKTVNVFLLLL